MSDVPLFSRSVDDLLALAAERTPYAGAGAMSALTCAHAGALVAMVGRYVGGDGAGRVQQAEAAMAELRELADADETAFGVLLSAWRLPRDDPDRGRRIGAGAREASEVPLRVCVLGAELADAADELRQAVKPDLRGDAVVAGRLAVAAVRSAAALVEVNAGQAEDGERLRREAAESVAAAARVTAALDEFGLG